MVRIQGELKAAVYAPDGITHAGKWREIISVQGRRCLCILHQVRRNVYMESHGRNFAIPGGR